MEIIGASGLKILTNIRVHIRDWVPKSLVKRLVIQSREVHVTSKIEKFTITSMRY